MVLSHIILTIIPTALCQYGIDSINTGMEPDVTFGDHNDRFDLTSMIQQQNAIHGNNDEDLRRNIRSEETNDPGNLDARRRRPVRRNQIRHKELRRSDRNDYAYRDNMETQEIDGGVDEYETNLQAYKARSRRYRDLVNYLHGSHGGRRSGRNADPADLEKDILVHYAVPIEMKVQGYLQAPIEE